MRAVFLDRDGTVTVGVPTYDRVDSVDKVRLLPNVLPALQLLSSLNYKVFMVTNQAGLAEQLITWDDYEHILNKVYELIGPSGITIEKTYVCPHSAEDNCDCRKPKPKLLLDAAKEYDIDLSSSWMTWMIGDRVTDIQCGLNAGTKTILVRTGDPNAKSDQATYTAENLLAAISFVQKSDAP